MNNKIYIWIAAIAGAVILACGYTAGYQADKSVGGGDGNVARSCTVTHAVATIGHQVSSTLLSANSRRAWAAIQQPTNATNTASLSFGGTAVAGQGYGLVRDAQNDTASSSDAVNFGLNTDFPFTGAITGMTSNGSSTVLTTECIYAN